MSRAESAGKATISRISRPLSINDNENRRRGASAMLPRIDSGVFGRESAPLRLEATGVVVAQSESALIDANVNNNAKKGGGNKKAGGKGKWEKQSLPHLRLFSLPFKIYFRSLSFFYFFPHYSFSFHAYLAPLVHASWKKYIYISGRRRSRVKRKISEYTWSPRPSLWEREITSLGSKTEMKDLRDLESFVSS